MRHWLKRIAAAVDRRWNMSCSTRVFDEDRYFDIFVEYAKGSPEDILIRIQIINRGPETAALDLLPTIWFRNTWSWGYDVRAPTSTPARLCGTPRSSIWSITTMASASSAAGAPELLFTENETNDQRLYGTDNPSPYVKDGINDYIVHGQQEAVNPQHIGTKAAAHYHLASARVRPRLCVCGSASATPSARAGTPLPRTLIRSSWRANTKTNFMPR